MVHTAPLWQPAMVDLKEQEMSRTVLRHRLSIARKTSNTKEAEGVCYGAQKVLGVLAQEQNPSEMDEDMKHRTLTNASALYEMAVAHGAPEETIKSLQEDKEA